MRLENVRARDLQEVMDVDRVETSDGQTFQAEGHIDGALRGHEWAVAERRGIEVQGAVTAEERTVEYVNERQLSGHRHGELRQERV